MTIGNIGIISSAQTLYAYLGGIPAIPKGATHADDLMYIFYFGDYTKYEEKLMSETMLNFYENFATNQ